MKNTSSIKDTFILDCEPEVAFKAWLDSKTHAAMVGDTGEAKIDATVGGEFDIWDGAITGKTLEIDEKENRIIQAWRYEYDDWSKDEPSELTIQFLPHGDHQTEVKFEQTDLPEQYAKEVAEGWKEYYWKPMQEYFKKK